MAAIVTAIVTKVAGATFAASAFGGLVINAITSLATSFIQSAFASKPNQGGLGQQGRTDMIRQAITSRRVVYGDAKVSGPLVFVHMTDDNDLLHIVLALANNECNAATTFWFDDEEITIDGTGKVTSPEKYVDHAWIYPHLGTETQAADASLISHAGDKWTSAHQLKGITYVYVRLRWNSNIYPNGIPNISAQLQGNNQVLDTRTSTTAFSRNPALCIRDYLTNTKYGMSVPTSEIDTASFNTAANVCEELVPLAAGGNEFRYQMNGVVELNKTPEVVLGEMLTSMQGQLSYENGQFKILAGEYRTPTQTITVDDIIGPISVQTRVGAKNLHNGVKGIYISPDNNWQTSDFPAVQDSSLVAEDGGEEKWMDVELPFTTSTATCQRIAKILLSKSREQITVNLSCHIGLLSVAAGDVINLTLPRYGWNAKNFEVVTWNLDISEQGDDGPVPTINLSLKSISASSYNWTAGVDEIEVVTDRTTLLPDPFTVAAPASVAATSGTDQLIINGSGDVVSRILIAWEEPSDAFILKGGSAEVQYKQTSDAVYETVRVGDAATGSFFISPVQEGILYDIRVRFINQIGAKGEWSYVLGHTVIGKTSPPSDVVGFGVVQNVSFTTFNWSVVSDPDILGYEIRIGPKNITTWEDARPLSETIKVNSWTTSTVAPGDYTLFIKAKDTSGNYSTNAAAVSFTKGNSGYTTDTQRSLSEDGWVGDLDKMVIHGPTQSLVPDTTTNADDLGYDMFDYGINTFHPLAKYTWQEIDLGSDKDIRVWANISSKKLSGTLGAASPRLLIRTRGDGESSGILGFSSVSIINGMGSVSNMELHHTGKLVPGSKSFASVEGAFDEFVIDAYETCEYTSQEYSFTEDTKVNLSIVVNGTLGPEELLGVPNIDVQVDYRSDAGSYGGFRPWVSGEFTGKFFKVRLTTSTLQGKTVIESANMSLDTFTEFSGVGEYLARYVQIRLEVDTSKGVAVITDYNITVDNQ